MKWWTEKEYLTYDDVLLVPKYSEVSTRSSVDISSGGILDLKTPIISSNMDTITGSRMCIAMHQLGGLGILHRFLTEDQLNSELNILSENLPKNRIAASIGVKPEDFAKLDLLLKHAGIICVDIAHGHSAAALRAVSKIRTISKSTIIIAGNVATGQATIDLMRAGADIVKVGIGGGSHCSTRVVTGHGLPQLSAVAECAAEAAKCGIEIISDGGIKNSGDIAKSIAAGANYVMLGSLLSATDETPTDVITLNGERYKQYRGMASAEAQSSVGKTHPTPEGVSKLKKCKGPVSNIINQLSGGLKSAYSYSGAINTKQFKESARFIRVSGNTPAENVPHGLLLE